ncbi:MAG TPA: tyrosine-type recombinase/integrase [Actinomycetota bacterium]|nr:tyrosine-type recombinase/integrase [Actinomycetota bacterium]
MDKGASLSETSLAEFLRSEWLPAIRTTVRATTFSHYVTHVECQIVPHLGHLRLNEVHARTINSFYATLLARGRVDGNGGLAASSVRRLHAALHKALKDAVRWGYLSENPVDAADPPKLRAEEPKEMATWSAAQLRQFLNAVRDDSLHPFWFVLATTGMRWGEALGLRWCDLDLEAGHIVIRQSIVNVGREVQLSTPKTSRSRRVVAIDQRTRQVLGEFRAGWNDAVSTQLIFERCFRGGISPTAATKRFRRLIETHGFPVIRLHDLRHTHATLALQAGVHPKIVSERLGHSTVSLTLDVYSHAVPHMQRDAADQIAQVIFDE